MEQAEEPATAAADEGPAKRVKHATEALIDTPSETTEAMLEAQQPASKLEDIATVETEQIGETDLKMDMETGVATEPATETSTGMEAEVEAAAENSIVASVSAVKQAIHATQDMDTSSEQTLVAAEVEQAALPSDAEKAATSNATDIVSSLARKPPPPSASPTPTATGPQLDPQVHVESSYNTMLRRGRPKSKKVVKVVAVPLAVQEGFKPHEDPDITAGMTVPIAKHLRACSPILQGLISSLNCHWKEPQLSLIFWRSWQTFVSRINRLVCSFSVAMISFSCTDLQACELQTCPNLPGSCLHIVRPSTLVAMPPTATDMLSKAQSQGRPFQKPMYERGCNTVPAASHCVLCSMWLSFGALSGPR
jgi:hypothetical protein